MKRSRQIVLLGAKSVAALGLLLLMSWILSTDLRSLRQDFQFRRDRKILERYMRYVEKKLPLALTELDLRQPDGMQAFDWFFPGGELLSGVFFLELAEKEANCEENGGEPVALSVEFRHANAPEKSIPLRQVALSAEKRSESFVLEGGFYRVVVRNQRCLTENPPGGIVLTMADKALPESFALRKTAFFWKWILLVATAGFSLLTLYLWSREIGSFLQEVIVRKEK